MTLFEIIFDIILGVLFVAANVMYVIHALHWNNSILNYDAFDDIRYVSEMNTFGKILSSILVSITCFVGIAIMYAIKFVYWVSHYKKG